MHFDSFIGSVAYIINFVDEVEGLIEFHMSDRSTFQAKRVS